MISICDEVIAFGDIAKYGKDAPYGICGWDQVSHVVVDGELGSEFVDLFHDRNIILRQP